MSTQPEPARMHLLRANAAPIVVIIRRKPSILFHIIKWNTAENTFEHGSWFNGKLYPMRCDISPDGEWMVYLAMGQRGQTWNGICKVPWLKTFAEAKNTGTWYGGGYWDGSDTLQLNNWHTESRELPFKIQTRSDSQYGEDEGVLFHRMKVAGWKRAGDNWGENRRIENINTYQIECVGDDGWQFQPTPKHPILRTKYIGYLEKGRTFRFSFDEYPDLLDEKVEWATWDFSGNLVFARQGTVNLYRREHLGSGTPTFAQSFETLTRHKQEQK